MKINDTSSQSGLSFFTKKGLSFFYSRRRHTVPLVKRRCIIKQRGIQLNLYSQTMRYFYFWYPNYSIYCYVSIFYLHSSINSNPYQIIRSVKLSSYRSCLSGWSFINWLHISSLQTWFKMKQHRLLTLVAFNCNSCSVQINQQILCTLRTQDSSGLLSISLLQTGWKYHIKLWHYLLKIRIEGFRFINFTIQYIFFYCS